MIKNIEYPFDKEQIEPLRVGDRVSLSGPIFTGRDLLHSYLFEGGKCPVDLRNGGLFHCGPVIVRAGDGWVARAAGPTTSMRQEPYLARIIEQYGLSIIIGKGGMGEGTRKACAEHSCIYVQAVGGTASSLARTIRKVVRGHFVREFGMAEAMWELVVEGMDGVVTMDTRGRSLHKRVAASSKRELKALLAQ
jgi:fumarate hydratase class I